MPPRPSERLLRRLVTDLAERPKADVRAVLADLEPLQRARVEQLMSEFRGEAGSVRPASELSPSTSTQGLSPWLAARVRTAADGEAASEFTMTRHALDALRLAAAATGAERRPTGVASAARPGTAIFDWVSRWLSGPTS